jgi:hypothetical protein
MGSYLGEAPNPALRGLSKKDIFTGDGSTTTFDLAIAIPNVTENDIEVFVENIRQEPGTGKAYTLGFDGSSSFKRITFSAAPASGAAIYVISGTETTRLLAIADNTVSTAKIQDGAITAAKIADGAIVATEIANNAVTTAKILDANVTTAKITDANVTTAKIADNNVTTAKILDANVTNAKLANSSITINGSAVSLGGSVNVAETKPTVADVSQTIIPATATDINITGTNFVAIPKVEFINASTGVYTSPNTTSQTNTSTLAVNVTLASGNYFVRVENPDGNAARSTNNIITASTAPTFSTSAGSLGTFAGNFSGTLATISASSDSTIAFAETTSVLAGAGVTLNTSTGALTTSDFGGSSIVATTYTFTLRITDAESQTATREFSMTSSFGATGGAQFNP